MLEQELMERITSKPNVCGGRPCIRDTRIEIAVILDGLAEGMTEPELVDHYPQLTADDLHACVAVVDPVHVRARYPLKATE